MTNDIFFVLATTVASVSWIILVLVHVVDWDIRRQRRADLEIQHGGGIRHKSGCLQCARTHITIKKKLVYVPQHSKHLYSQRQKEEANV